MRISHINLSAFRCYVENFKAANLYWNSHSILLILDSLSNSLFSRSRNFLLSWNPKLRHHTHKRTLLPWITLTSLVQFTSSQLTYIDAFGITSDLYDSLPGVLFPVIFEPISCTSFSTLMRPTRSTIRKSR